MPWSPLPTRDGSGGPPPVRLPDVLDRVLGGLGAPTVSEIVLVHERWADVVGEEMVVHARPLGIEHGRLKVGVDSPAWASHLRWSEAEILGRLDQILGAGVITAVTTRVVRPERAR